MRRLTYLIAILFFLCPVFVMARSNGFMNNEPTRSPYHKKFNPHDKMASPSAEFKDAGRQFGNHMTTAGADLGHGTVEFGSKTVQGKPVKGSVALAQGVGGFGKNVGVGTGKAATHIFKGTADGAVKIKNWF